ncbi:MAG: prevent-host-death protein [Cyanobium sp. M30B3]|nr:MAG: prevent-host-death protein [Cyanobium sp. M30B3]
MPASPIPPPRPPAPRQVNMLEAKTQLSRLVEAIETGEHSEIVIARSGRPVARLTTLDTARRGRCLGVAYGQFTAPDSIDSANPQIAGLFGPQS